MAMEQLLLSASPNWYLSHVVAVTADGAVAAYAGHQSVTVLCCHQQRLLRCLWPQRCRASSVVFAADDTLLVVGYEDGSARCFKWQTGECVSSRAASKAKRKQSTSELTAALAPSWLEGTAVFADAGGQLLLWPFAGGGNSKYLVLADSCSSKVHCLTAAPHSSQHCRKQVIAGCENGSCVLVDVPSGCQLARWRAHSGSVHSLTWLQTPLSSQQGQVQQEQGQQQQQAALGPAEEVPAAQAGSGAVVSSSGDGCGDGCGTPQQQHCAGFLVSVGADGVVRVWQVPSLGSPQSMLPASAAVAASAAAESASSDTAPAASHAEPEAGAATAAAGPASTATGDRAAVPAVDASAGDAATQPGEPPAAAPAVAAVTSHTAAEAEAAASATAADAKGTDLSSKQATSSTPSIEAAAAGAVPAPAAAPAKRSSPAVLQLQPLSAAVVDPTAAAAGGASARGPSPGAKQQFYGAAAVVLSSVCQDGSCLVVCAGGTGRIGAVAMLTGHLRCRWAALPYSPHSRGIFQLLLLPCVDQSAGTGAPKQPKSPQEAPQQQQQPQQQDKQPLHQQEREQVPLPLSETQQGEQQQQAAGQELQSQPQKAAAQQRQQEPALNAEPPQQQQQQQQQQGPMLPWPGCGSYRVVSVSMDRCFAVSKLDIQPAVTAAPAPAPAPAAGSKGKQGSAGGITLTLPAQPGTKGPTPAAAAAAAVAPSLAAAPAAAASAGSIGFAAGDGSGSSSGGGGGDGSVSLQLSGCDPLWVCQGTGGFVYSCAGQPSFADAVEAWPKYSKVRLAVGSGDKTIRALSLRVRAAPTQQQQQKEGVVAGVSGGSDADADSSAVAAAAAPNGSSAATADGPSSSSSSSSGGGGSAVAAGVCGPELQLPFAKPTLLWKNISDRPQAIAWHPTNPRLLAFGCHDGALGVYDISSTQVVPYSKRHGGPVIHLAWQQQQHELAQPPATTAPRPQQQQQQQGGNGLSLLSLGGEGCLLSWPAIAPGNSGSWAQPTDIGARLQALLPAAGVADTGGQRSWGGGSNAGAGGFVHWSCLSVSLCGSSLAVGNTRGQMVLLKRTQGAEGPGGAAAAGSSSGSGREASWRGAYSISPWQLLACVDTPAGQPLKAAAWQPQPGYCAAPGTADSTSATSSSTAAAAGAAFAAAAEATAAAAEATAALVAAAPALLPPLLAAISEQQLHVWDTTVAGVAPPAAGDPHSSCPLASCSVSRNAQQQQQHQHQQQLLSLAWAAADTICVGCSDGSIQVVRVNGHVNTPAAPAAVVAAGAAVAAPAPTAAAGCQVSLMPLYALKGHTGPVLSVAGMPGWRGLLLSGSQDQTLRCWHPLQEAAAAEAAPAGLKAEAPTGAHAAGDSDAAAAGTAGTASPPQHDAAPSLQPDAGATGAVAAAAAGGAGAAAAAVAAQGGKEAAAAAAAAGLTAESAPVTHAAPEAATAGAAAPTAKAKYKASKTVICPQAKSFLPELPDTCEPLIQQQVLLDVVALAEALYPPAEALNPSVVGAGALNPSGTGGAAAGGLDPQVLKLLGVGSMTSAGASGQEQQQQQQPQGQGLRQQHQAQEAEGIAEGFRQQLAGAVGSDYALGSWLPNLTADVTELLQQHQCWTTQQQQQREQRQQKACGQPGNVSGLSGDQVAMLQFVAGDVKGFLQAAAAAADSITPDVVALSAAGGKPAFSTAARLAAVRLAAVGEQQAAAVHLLAAGDAEAAAAAAAAAAAVLQH